MGFRSTEPLTSIRSQNEAINVHYFWRCAVSAPRLVYLHRDRPGESCKIRRHYGEQWSVAHDADFLESIGFYDEEDVARIIFSCEASSNLEEWLLCAGIASERAKKYAVILLKNDILSIEKLRWSLVDDADRLESIGIFAKNDVLPSYLQCVLLLVKELDIVSNPQQIRWLNFMEVTTPPINVPETMTTINLYMIHKFYTYIII